MYYLRHCMRKKVGIFLLFFSSLFGTEKSSPTLKIGMELSYPPFETIDKEGKPSGISVDLAYALGSWMHEAILIENIPFIGLIPSLNANKIDLILSSMTVTQERTQAIDFSDPYLEIGLCFLISKQTKSSSLQDLDQKGNIIVVKVATTGEVFAKEHITQAKIIALDQEASCIMEVVQGKANAFLYDQISIYNSWQRYPEETKVSLFPVTKEKWAIGMRKGDDELRRKVNAFLLDFEKTGGFKKLADKYLSKEQKAFKELNVPFVFSVREP